MAEHAHEDVRRLFDLVLETPTDQRASVLDRACGGDEALRARVLAMIEAVESDRFLSRPTGAGVDEATLDAPPQETGPRWPSRESAGQQIDRYKLLQPIGEGGFGTVWMAEQKEPVKRRVALKIIKLGMDTRQVIARFEAERQALAMMDHPNIAKVLDAGTTETGRPYFAMEYIRGVPIIEYCDTEKLDTRARLDLFTQVCHALQHAHQKGIIHRDIKPSNVLVTMHDGVPVPKVIDFGIAKATNTELTQKTLFTEHRQMIGTPAYMSPEQAEMSGLDIDTRSDIYSLGVLLYEMLTGTTPFTNEELASAGFEGMMRIIREVEPHKPSIRLSSLGDTATQTAQERRADVKQLGLILRGDLDWIVMKCLEKDRTRRYATANGLAADIQRHLDDEPVTAGPPSAGYKLGKFVKRNRGQVIAAGVVAATLVLGVIGTSLGMAWAWREKGRADEQAMIATAAAAAERAAKLESQANEQRAVDEATRAEAAEADAEARAEELEAVALFQSTQLSSVDPAAMGERLRQSILEEAPEQDREALHDALGPVNFTDIALASLETEIFQRAIAAVDEQFAAQPAVRARLLQTSASTMRELGLLRAAVDPQQRSLRLRRETLGGEHPDTLLSLNELGVLMSDLGRMDEAEAAYGEALSGRKRVLGEDHPDTLVTMNNMGDLMSGRGRLDEAEPYWRAALEGRRRVLGPDHGQTLTSLNNLAYLLRNQGRLAEAEPLFREALAARRRLSGEGHADTLVPTVNLGSLVLKQGRIDEAEPLYRRAMEIARRTRGDEHPTTLVTINNMGFLHTQKEDYERAEIYYREALDGRSRVLGRQHRSTLNTLNNLAFTLERLDRLEEAERLYREAVDTSSKLRGDAHINTLFTMNNLTLLLVKREDFEEALAVAQQAKTRARRTHGEDHWIYGDVLNRLGRAQAKLGRFEQAEATLLAAQTIQTRTRDAAHREYATAIRYLAELYEAWHDAEPGAGHDATAVDWRARLAALEAE